MNEPKTEHQTAIELDEDEIAAYLQSHEDFLQRHPEVLGALQVSHDAGGAVSLIERQVQGLRHENQKLHTHLSELVSTARENELRVQHMNSLASVLIAADTPKALVDGLRRCVHRELSVDDIFIGVLGGDEVAVGGIHALGRESAQMEGVTNAFRRGKPLCGPLSQQQIDALFPDQGDTPPQSAALIPLGKGDVRGVLVLASRDSRRFVPEMGTLFLELMGELVTTACRRHLGADKI